MAIEAAIRKIKVILEENRLSKVGGVIGAKNSPNLRKSSMFKMFDLVIKAAKKKAESNKNIQPMQSRLKLTEF